jgi:hypothetical protein
MLTLALRPKNFQKYKESNRGSLVFVLKVFDWPCVFQSFEDFPLQYLFLSKVWTFEKTGKPSFSSEEGFL